MNNKEQQKGICPICGRIMINGNSINEHHLVPKSLKGKDKIILHKICHQKIHSVFTERELFKEYKNIEKIKSHPEIQKFIKWIIKKKPTYYMKNKDTCERNEKRKAKRRNKH